MDETTAPDLPVPCPALALGVINLMLLTELQMRLGIDPDGSHTIDRAQGLAGAGLQLDPLVRLREGGDEGRAEALHSLKAYLRRMAPLLQRMARPAAGPD